MYLRITRLFVHSRRSSSIGSTTGSSRSSVYIKTIRSLRNSIHFGINVNNHRRHHKNNMKFFVPTTTSTATVYFLTIRYLISGSSAFGAAKPYGTISNTLGFSSSSFSTTTQLHAAGDGTKNDKKPFPSWTFDKLELVRRF